MTTETEGKHTKAPYERTSCIPHKDMSLNNNPPHISNFTAIIMLLHFDAVMKSHLIVRGTVSEPESTVCGAG